MSDDLDQKRDLEINVSDKTGRSPFVYMEGMDMAEEEGQRETSLPYFRKCMSDRTLTMFKFDILKCVYRHAYLNRYIIDKMVGSRYPKNDLKDAISWLVKRGMLHRLKFTKDGFMSRYFYCVGEGVSQFMKMNGKIAGTPCTFDAVYAIYRLCRAQFAACAESYAGFVRSDIHTSFSLPVTRKVFDLGYRAEVKCRDGKPLTLLAVAVRRNPGWEDELRKIIHIAGAYSVFNRKTCPVLICEDGTHMVEAARVIRDASPELLGRRFLFTDDHSTAEWNLGSALLEWNGNRRIESDDEDFAPFGWL